MLRAQGAEEGARPGGSAAPRLPGAGSPAGLPPPPGGRPAPCIARPPAAPARSEAGAARLGTARRGGTPPEVRARGCAPAAARPTSGTGGGARGCPFLPPLRWGPGHDPRLTSEMEMRGVYPRAGGEGVGEKSGTAKPFLVLFCSSFQ